MYTYMVSLFDNATQDPIHLLIKGDKQLVDVLCARPEHHVISSVQNLGPCDDANEYLTELKRKES